MNNNTLPNPQMLTKTQIAAANKGIAQMQTMQSKADAKAAAAATKQAQKISAAKIKEAEKAQKKIDALANKQQRQNTRVVDPFSTSTASTSRFVKTLKVGESALLSLGKSIQSTGRQLTYNFTYPLVLAGRQIFTFAMANETALTNLKKVYGDADTGAQRFAEDQKDLGRVFRDLSDIYGIQQSDIISLAASWAAAGATGYGLAKALQTTAEAINLFDFTSPEEAVTSLISIQTAFKLNANELEAALFSLNSVENATAVTGADLVAAFVRVGSTAEASGVTVKQLAADIAALVPTTGSAETAGNGLKTIFTRLLSPTAQAVKAFKQIGLSFDDWKSSGATAQTRLEDIAKAFAGLNDTQKVFIATQIAGRFQANRFVELMAQIVDPTSAYSRALKVTTKDADSLAVAQNEINLKLQSSPQAFKILTTRIQNMLVSAIMPLIPTLLQVVAMIEKLVNAFNNLGQGTKNMIIFGLTILAAIGPVTRITGAFIELFAIVGSVGGKLIKAGLVIKKVLFGVSESAVAAASAPLAASEGIVAAFLSPWFLIPAAIAGIFLLFRKQITDALAPVIEWLRSVFDKAIDGIVRGFYALPTGIQTALMAVYNIAARIMKGIVNVLSYLNPFARHSPSLVDNVDAGVAHIIASYSKLSGIGDVFKKASADFESFKTATAGVTADFNLTQRVDQRRQIIDIAPEAGPSVDAAYQSIDALQGVMDELTSEILKQKKVVDDLSISLDAANRAYDKQNDILSVMKDRLDRTNEQLSAAKQAMDDFANAPIAGMKDMNEQIFANDMAQKRLRLEILKLEDVGGTYDDLKAKVQSLKAEIESLQNRQNELRSGGAGSEILGFYDEQIKMLYAQQKAYENNLAPIQALQDQLDKLSHAAEELDLEKSLKFDPLKHQIDDLVDSTKELTFEEIINGIKKTKPRVDELTKAYDAQKAAIDTQQAIVDKYKDQRDQIQAVYDTEKSKLEDLNSTYDAASENVRTLTDALDGLIQAQQAASSAAAASAGAGEGADFPAGPAGLPDTTGSLAQLADDLDKKSKEFFGKMDFFKPLRDQWGKVVKWWDDHVVSEWNSMVADLRPQWIALVNSLQDAWNSVFGNLDTGNFSGKVKDEIGGIGDWLHKTLTPVGHQINDLFKDVNFIKVIGGWLAEIRDVGKRIGEEISKWSDLWEPFKKAAQQVWTQMQLVGAGIAVIIGAIVEVIKVGLKVILPIVRPIIKAIGDVIIGTLRTIHGLIKIILGLISLDFKTVWSGILDIVNGIFGTMWKLILDAGRILNGALQGIFDGLVGYLWSLVKVIYHIFEDSGNWLLEAGKNIFLGLWHGMTWVWDQLWNFFFGHSVKTWIIDYFVDAITWLLSAGGLMIQGLWNGMLAGWNYVTAWLGTLKTAVMGYVVDAITWFFATGANIIAGLLKGITTGWESVKTWLGGIKEKVTGVITSPIDWLADSGRKIIGGFVDGMKSAWSSLNPVGWFSDALTGLTDLWPFSPAKAGPLKDKPPEDAGYRIGELFASGMMASAGQISTSATMMVDAAANAFATGTANAVNKAQNDAEEAKSVIADLKASTQTISVSGITYTIDAGPAQEAAKVVTSSFGDIETKYAELSKVVENNKAFQELNDTFNTAVTAYEESNKAFQKDPFSTDAIDKTKKYRDAMDETRLAILKLTASFKEMPAEVQTKITTLLDNNDIAGAKKALEDYASTSGAVAVQAELNGEATRAQVQLTSEALQKATELAQGYQNTINSLDFKNAGLVGATQAIGDFNKQLFADKDAIANTETAKAQFEQAIASGTNVDETGKVTKDWSTNFDLTTEAGRAGLKAIEDLANSMTGPLAQAFADSNGDFEAFKVAANEISNDALAEFQDQLGLSSTQVDDLRKSLGLTEGDWKARFDLSGAAEAQIKIGLLQSTISDITDPVWKANIQTQILNGDYVGAVNTVKSYFDQNSPTMPTAVDAPYNLDAVTASVREQMGINTIGMTTSLQEPLNKDQFLATVQEQIQANKAAPIDMMTVLMNPPNKDDIVKNAAMQMGQTPIDMLTILNAPPNQTALVDAVQDDLAAQDLFMNTVLTTPVNQQAIVDATRAAMMTQQVAISSTLGDPSNKDSMIQSIQDNLNANPLVIPTIFGLPLTDFVPAPGEAATPLASGTGMGGFAGGLTMLAERGRELVHLPKGSTVFNNLNTEKIIRSTQGGSSTAQTFNSQENKSSVNINGDLSFPNITKPDDAEKFIRNLEALANS